MRFAPTQAPSRNGGDDNLIPLINVVFLMLIFFMVAGQISRSDAVSIVPPASLSEKSTADDTNRVQVLISAAEGLFVDDRPSELEEIGIELTQRHAAAADPEAFSVLVKADATIPVEQLQAVLKQIRAAGLMKVSLATQLQGASS